MVASTEQLANRIWDVATMRLRGTVAANIFTQWFANMIPVRVEGRTLIIGVAEEFFADWVNGCYAEEIEKSLQAIDGVDYRYKLEAGHEIPEVGGDELDSEETPVVSASRSVMERPLTARCGFNEPVPERPRPQVSASRSNDFGASKIIDRYTFASFVVGEENRYAYEAARRAAMQPGLFNPLYIYGNTGIGKTHLLHAVAHEALARNPRIAVRYTPCEQLLNSFVEALKNHDYTTFRADLRNVDMLLVDDIHLLGKKTELQEQFFNAFNALYAENKQIILTSDKRPSEIVGLEDRLISRFEQGVTTEIYAPGLEVRIAILRGMQEEFMVQFKDEVLEFIASRISSNVRKLRGALMQLLTRVSLDPGMPVTLDKVEGILHKCFEEEAAARIVTIDEIQKHVAEYFNLHLSDLLSSKRPKSIAEPRMVAMYLARKLTTNSFPQIGDAFGRNHATIMNAWTKVPELCAKDEELRRAVSVLERQLQA